MSKFYDTIDSQFRGIDAFWQKFTYLFDMMNIIEPLRPRHLVYPVKPKDNSAIWYMYTSSILRWKSVLVFLVPEFQQFLAVIERFYRHLCRCALLISDRVHRLTCKYSAVLFSVLVLDDIQHLDETETSDSSVARQLQLILQSRLKVFYSRIWDFNKSKKFSREAENRLLLNFLFCVPGLHCCIPPHLLEKCVPGLHCYKPPHLIEKSKFLSSLIRDAIPIRLPAAPLGLPACLLRRSNSRENCYENAETDECCCGWAFDSIPTLLGFFHISARSFARYIHCESQKNSLEGMGVASDLRKALNAVLQGPGIDNLILRKRMIIFGAAHVYWLGYSFRKIDHVLSRLYGKSKDTDDRRYSLAKGFRPHIFAHILQSAIFTLHKFWNSRREGEADSKSPELLYFGFRMWMSKEKEMDDAFVKKLLKLLSSPDAMYRLPDDFNASSQNDGTSDELEEMSM